MLGEDNDDELDEILAECNNQVDLQNQFSRDTHEGDWSFWSISNKNVVCLMPLEPGVYILFGVLIPCLGLEV